MGEKARIQTVRTIYFKLFVLLPTKASFVFGLIIDSKRRNIARHAKFRLYKIQRK